jgi:hypothetical protein
MEATENRESLEYVSETGKKAVITYSGIKVDISGAEQYDRIMAYLIPDSLSSFQRMIQDKFIFTEKLNSLLSYDVIVVAYKGEQIYYKSVSSAKPQTYQLNLSPIAPKALEKVLGMYTGSKTKDLVKDIDYQKFDFKEQKRKLKLQEELDQREIIARSIFPCYKQAPPADPTNGITLEK